MAARTRRGRSDGLAHDRRRSPLRRGRLGKFRCLRSGDGRSALARRPSCDAVERADHVHAGRPPARGDRRRRFTVRVYAGTVDEKRQGMAALSRRDFLRHAAADAAAAGFLAAGGARLRANPLGLPIGSQTWPHRQMIKDGNFAGLAKALADVGVQRVEMCSPLGYNDFASLTDGKQVKTILGDHGLSCESCHFNLRELREKQDQSLAWARDVGITQVIVASLGGTPKTVDDVKKAADEYNRIAAATAKA